MLDLKSLPREQADSYSQCEKKHSTMKRSTITTASRAFPIVVASISLIYNVFVAVLCQYLPDDPLYIGASISAYAWSGSVLSLLGLCGIIWRRPALVTSFAHFLLLDTLMSALSRILTLELTFDTFSTHDVCRLAHQHQLTHNDSQKSFSSPSSKQQLNPPPRHYELKDWHEPDPATSDVVAYARWQREMMRRSPQTQRCDNALSVMRVVAFGVLFCITVLQGMLAVAMRRYSRALERDRRAMDVEQQHQQRHQHQQQRHFLSSPSPSSSLLLLPSSQSMQGGTTLSIADEKR